MLSQNNALRSFLKLFLFLGVTGLCLLTAIGYQSLKLLTKAEAEARYEKQTRQITTRIGERMETHASILYRARAFVLVNRTPTQSQWETFFESQGIFQEGKGVDVVAFSRYVSGKRGTIEQTLSKDHGVDITITPTGDRGEYLPLVLGATANPATIKPFGFDLLSEPVRSAAINEARSSGQSVLTPPLTLLGGKRGIIMFLPVYAEENRLYGFISAVYYTDELMQGILDSGSDAQLSTQIVDATSKQEVYKSPQSVKGASTTRSDTLDMSSRQWSINYSAPNQTYGDGYLIPYAVLIVGIIFILGTLLSARILLRFTAVQSQHRQKIKLK